MANIPETVYTKDGVDAAIQAALANFVPPGLTNSVVDNGDGTTTITQAGGITDNGDGTGTLVASTGGGTGTFAIVDNGDGTFTLNSSTNAIVDNGNGTYTITA